VSQYYYLLATLPYLSFEQSQALDVEAFLAVCKEQLSASDYETLVSSAPGAGNSQSLVASVKLARSYEQGLRNALVKLRAAKLGWDTTSLRTTEDANDFTDLHPVMEVARSALNADNPYEAEEILDRFRFRLLEGMEVGHYFDIDRVVLYYLKLLVVKRRLDFVVARGQEAYRTQYEAVSASFPLELES